MNKNNFPDLMLDLETMGTDSYSAIVSIGAVEFDINTGETGKEYYKNIDLQSCLDLGLKANAATILWWMKQSEEARKSLIQNPKISINRALYEFSQFCSLDHYIWGNSARYDCGILADAYNQSALEIPWNYTKERCVRTLVSFNPKIKSEMQFKGIKHNPIDDCKFQIEYCSKTWASLSRGRN